jgi:hypothetical protein
MTQDMDSAAKDATEKLKDQFSFFGRRHIIDEKEGKSEGDGN